MGNAGGAVGYGGNSVCGHSDANINWKTYGELLNAVTGTASPYTSALGSGTPLDITPAYYMVHIWKRLS